MTIFLLFQITLAILLISAILLQARGTGLGSAFGGQNKSFHSKRGFEKFLFKATIALSAVFVISSIVSLF